MRRFSSYGPVNPTLHYYAPREHLIDTAYSNLVGEAPAEGGHYITVWAPRQCGKTWIIQEIVEKIKQTGRYEVAIISMERAKEVKDEKKILDILIEKLHDAFNIPFPQLQTIDELSILFTKKYFQKPVILALDEFDALEEIFINQFAGIFRDMFTGRTNERSKSTHEKTCLLHGLALIGIRSVLGIENQKGSPFNVQRSVHIPNLSYEEVLGMFQWYEKESGQKVDVEAVRQLYEETLGQPGLTCWFGELLTETYNRDKTKPISATHFEEAYAAASQVLPNNNILNIISKVKKSPYREWVLDLFKTSEKILFKFDDESINYLYMNGVIDEEKIGLTRYYVKFSCPFVQIRLFNYFSHELFKEMGALIEPFTSLENVITDADLNIPGILKLYQTYLEKNKTWLFQAAPRRTDMRIYEAVYHFNLFSYLDAFLRNPGGRVYPEFPTGNGKIDLIITYNRNRYGLELKSFTNEREYKIALERAAHYGKQLELPVIYLVFFVEYIDAANREKFEKEYPDQHTNTTVVPIFIVVGV